MKSTLLLAITCPFIALFWGILPHAIMGTGIYSPPVVPPSEEIDIWEFSDEVLTHPNWPLLADSHLDLTGLSDQAILNFLERGE